MTHGLNGDITDILLKFSRLAVGDWYARIIQHHRDPKDQVLAAVDEAALDAIDITAGLPA